CALPDGFLKTCQQVPQTLHKNGITYYGWNWSTLSSENNLFLGDGWSVSFNVMATGPPFALVPVDACTTLGCRAGGSGAVSGLFTQATYFVANTTNVSQSFPLGQVLVQALTPTGPPPNVPPASPPTPPGFPITIAPLTPIPAPVPVAAQLGIGTVSLQAAAAGFLGAGFMRVGLKNRPIAMAVAARSGRVRSSFDRGLSGDPRLGRFE
ncbi:MAG: hypothetical protein L3K06_01710, partial [Thermoplasmata archaeon]|nr:hypothetical protein [Thermoplasmata archaeon]